MNEHDEMLARVIRSWEGKVNKKDHNIIAKDVERIDKTLKQLLEQVNGISIPASPIINDDGKKYQELERIIVSLEDKVDRSRESISKRVTEVNKLINVNREEVDEKIKEQDKQCMKVMSRINRCEVRLSTIEKMLKNTSPTTMGPSLLDLDFKEAIQMIKDLEAKLDLVKNGE